MTLSGIARWLVFGSDVQTMSSDWLHNRMPAHDYWTRSQQTPGMALIVSDAKAMERKQFWQRLNEQKPRMVKSNVTPWKVSQK